jgi:hypothetical protein
VKSKNEEKLERSSWGWFGYSIVQPVKARRKDATTFFNHTLVMLYLRLCSAIEFGTIRFVIDSTEQVGQYMKSWESSDRSSLSFRLKIERVIVQHSLFAYTTYVMPTEVFVYNVSCVNEMRYFYIHLYSLMRR